MTVPQCVYTWLILQLCGILARLVPSFNSVPPWVAQHKHALGAQGGRGHGGYGGAVVRGSCRGRCRRGVLRSAHRGPRPRPRPGPLQPRLPLFPYSHVPGSSGGGTHYSFHGTCSLMPGPVGLEPPAYFCFLSCAQAPDLTPDVEQPPPPPVPATPAPTAQPTAMPTQLQPSPTSRPVTVQTLPPTAQPTLPPTTQPTARRTSHPSPQPTARRTEHPSPQPTARRTAQPSAQPTALVTARGGQPSTCKCAFPFKYHGRTYDDCKSSRTPVPDP